MAGSACFNACGTVTWAWRTSRGSQKVSASLTFSKDTGATG